MTSSLDAEVVSRLQAARARVLGARTRRRQAKTNLTDAQAEVHLATEDLAREVARSGLGQKALSRVLGMGQQGTRNLMARARELEGSDNA
jgi:hypothetical protein